MTQSISRLLVFAPNWLGDAVMAVPCLRRLRCHYPSATIAVAAQSHLAPLFEMVDGVGEVIAFEGAARVSPLGFGVLAAVRDARRLRAGRFDAAILLPNSFRAAWIARRAGIAERWGYAADGRARMLTRAVPRVRGGHQVEYYQRLLDALEVGQSNRSEIDAASLAEARSAKADVLRVRPVEREWARAMLAGKGWTGGRPLLGIAPGAAYGTAKQWPPDRFAQLVRELAEAGAASVLVGSGGDKPACDAIAALGALGSGGIFREKYLPTPGGRVINLAGATNLPQLAAVMAECRTFVSNDSGAMHLAAAVGVPVVAIFGSTNERETAPLPFAQFAYPPVAEPDSRPEMRPGLISGPGLESHAIVATDAWCRPCMLRECPLDHECMTGIPVGRVKAEVLKRLAN